MWMSPGNLPGRGILSKNISIHPTTTITIGFEFGVGSFEFATLNSKLKTENSQPFYIPLTTSFIIAVIFGSALFATAITSSSVIGFSVSGKHSSVMIETPKTFIPI